MPRLLNPNVKPRLNEAAQAELVALALTLAAPPFERMRAGYLNVSGYKSGIIMRAPHAYALMLYAPAHFAGQKTQRPWHVQLWRSGTSKWRGDGPDGEKLWQRALERLAQLIAKDAEEGRREAR